MYSIICVFFCCCSIDNVKKSYRTTLSTSSLSRLQYGGLLRQFYLWFAQRFKSVNFTQSFFIIKRSVVICWPPFNYSYYRQAWENLHESTSKNSSHNALRRKETLDPPCIIRSRDTLRENLHRSRDNLDRYEKDFKLIFPIKINNLFEKFYSNLWLWW